MSQQPDQSPSSYWQFDSDPEQDVQEAVGAGATVAPTVVISAAAQPVSATPHSGSPTARELASAIAPQASPPIAQPGRQRRRHSLLSILLPLLAVVLLVAVGSASGFQVNQMVRQRGQADASPTVKLGQVPTTPRVTPAATRTLRPSASPTPMPTAVVPSPTPQVVILAQDDFQRPNQALWGNASDGSHWGGDANTSPVFSILAGTGCVRGGQGFFSAILGPRTVNEEVVSSGLVSHFDNQRDNLGVVLRWTSNDSYYKAYLDGAALILIKRVAGKVFRLGAVPFFAQGGVSYSLRFRAAGSQLQVRAWPRASAEPNTWMIMANDSALASGFGGLRVLMEPGIIMSMTMFQERSIA